MWELCQHTLKATPFLALCADGNRERMPYEADLKMPTPRGAVRVAWTKGGNGLSLEVTVPANTQAEILLPPSRGEGDITESDERLDAAPGVQVRGRQGDRTVVEVGGGTYRFRITSSPARAPL